MEWLDGASVREVDWTGVPSAERVKLADSLLRTFLEQMLQEGNEGPGALMTCGGSVQESVQKFGESVQKSVHEKGGVSVYMNEQTCYECPVYRKAVCCRRRSLVYSSAVPWAMTS